MCPKLCTLYSTRIRLLYPSCFKRPNRLLVWVCFPWKLSQWKSLMVISNWLILFGFCMKKKKNRDRQLVYCNWRAPCKPAPNDYFEAIFQVAPNRLKFGMSTLCVLKNVTVFFFPQVGKGFKHILESRPPPPPSLSPFSHLSPSSPDGSYGRSWVLCWWKPGKTHAELAN